MGLETFGTVAAIFTRETTFVTACLLNCTQSLFLEGIYSKKKEFAFLEELIRVAFSESVPIYTQLSAMVASNMREGYMLHKFGHTIYYPKISDTLFQTLCPILFRPNFCVLCTRFLKCLVEWQTM